jgi:mannose-6-phosphate isomerase-like protein (cupin superfamily)
MNLSRRDFAAALPALIAGSQFAAAPQEQSQAHLPSGVYAFADLPVRRSDNLEYRPIIEGQTIGSCTFSVHESSLAPNSEPHPPHHHEGEEMFLILNGTLEFTIHGKPTRAGASSVMFAASNDLHGIRNPDDTHAKYFVFPLGPENQ